MQSSKYVVQLPQPIPKEVTDFKNIPGGMPDFLVNFFSVDKYALSDLIMASIELSIDSLRDLTAAKMALELRGKSTEEMREWYEWTEDEIGFTPEEEERNVWEQTEAKEAYGNKW